MLLRPQREDRPSPSEALNLSISCYLACQPSGGSYGTPVRKQDNGERVKREERTTEVHVVKGPGEEAGRCLLGPIMSFRLFATCPLRFCCLPVKGYPLATSATLFVTASAMESVAFDCPFRKTMVWSTLSTTQQASEGFLECLVAKGFAVQALNLGSSRYQKQLSVGHVDCQLRLDFFSKVKRVFEGVSALVGT